MEWTAVSANLGCGAVHSAETVVAAREWVAAAGSDECDLLFLQEAPAAAVDDLSSSYTVHAHPPGATTYSCRSLLAVRKGSGIESGSFTLDSAGYHGSYVAAAEVTLPGQAPAVFVSLHAAPAKVEARYLALWPHDPPEPRRASGGTLWDSDMVAATVIRLAAAQPVLAAGDFNEARGFDVRDGKPWGVEYFAGLRDHGLVDSTFGRWGDAEHPTRGEFQDDHVVATADLDALVDEPVVTAERGVPGESDHQPLRWTLRAPAGSVSR